MDQNVEALHRATAAPRCGAGTVPSTSLPGTPSQPGPCPPPASRQRGSDHRIRSGTPTCTGTLRQPAGRRYHPAHIPQRRPAPSPGGPGRGTRPGPSIAPNPARRPTTAGRSYGGCDTTAPIQTPVALRGVTVSGSNKSIDLRLSHTVGLPNGSAFRNIPDLEATPPRTISLAECCRQGHAATYRNADLRSSILRVRFRALPSGLPSQVVAPERDPTWQGPRPSRYGSDRVLATHGEGWTPAMRCGLFGHTENDHHVGPYCLREQVSQVANTGEVAQSNI